MSSSTSVKFGSLGEQALHRRQRGGLDGEALAAEAHIFS
jgi:hypothetical protein